MERKKKEVRNYYTNSRHREENHSNISRVNLFVVNIGGNTRNGNSEGKSRILFHFACNGYN